jgi:hypothetical protein
MATLKGQNFRIIATEGSSLAVIAMATNCTVTLNNNTEDASTKDDVGNSSMPSVVSKSWSVSVESLKVLNLGQVLDDIKFMRKLFVMWDEVSTTNNQTMMEASFARSGYAFLNDATFTFNDRENSAKSLQFSGASPLGKITKGTVENSVFTPNPTYTKGQFVRLFIGDNNTAVPSKVIAAAKSLSFHVSMSLEDATTKDTTGEWQVQEPTSVSYDITTNALVRGGDTIEAEVGAQDLSSIMNIYESGMPVKWVIANVSGPNNRTIGTKIVSGSAVLTQLTINAANRQNADYTANLAGYGQYTIGN